MKSPVEGITERLNQAYGNSIRMDKSKNYHVQISIGENPVGSLHQNSGI